MALGLPDAVLHAAARRPAGSARPAGGRAHRHRPGAGPARRRLLRHHRHPPAGLRRRPRVLPHAARRASASLPIPHQVFWEDEAMGRPLVRWAFCKQADVLARGLDRLAGLTADRSLQWDHGGARRPSPGVGQVPVAGPMPGMDSRTDWWPEAGMYTPAQLRWHDHHPTWRCRWRSRWQACSARRARTC